MKFQPGVSGDVPTTTKLRLRLFLLTLHYLQTYSHMRKDVGVNLAVSFSCIVGCPICKIYLVDHGYRKFKEKIHFMEQYR